MLSCVFFINVLQRSRICVWSLPFARLHHNFVAQKSDFFSLYLLSLHTCTAHTGRSDGQQDAFLPLALLHCPMILFCIAYKKYKPPFNPHVRTKKYVLQAHQHFAPMFYAYARAHTNGLFRPFVSVCCVCFATGGFFSSTHC